MLYTDGTAGIDFVAPYEHVILDVNGLHQPGMYKIAQSRYKWDGSGIIRAYSPSVPASDHAIVAFGQGYRPGYYNSPQHGFSQLFDRGIGAILGFDGLSLELWHGRALCNKAVLAPC